MEIDNIYDKLEKIAKDTKSSNDKEQKGAERKSLTGLGVAGGGAIGIGKLDRSGELTGTRKGYHITDKSAVKSIKEKGILSTDKVDRDKSITKAVAQGNDFMKEEDIVGKTYIARNKGVAKQVGASRMQSGIADIDGQEIIKTRLPYSEYKKRKTANPETQNYKNSKHFSDSLIDKLNKQMKKQHSVEGDVARELGFDEPKDFKSIKKGGLVELMFRKSYRDLEKGTDVLKGDIAPQHIKGGKGYKAVKAYGNNFIDHVKNNPEVFAKGLGKGVAGAGAVGLGGKMFLDAEKKKQELKKTATERVYEFDSVVNNIFSPEILKLQIKHINMYNDMQKIATEKAEAKDINGSLEKLANDAKKKEDERKAKQVAGATTVSIGGKRLYDLEHSGRVTGTRKGYHITDKKNVKSIKENGILPTDKADPRQSITEFVPGRMDPKTREAFNNKTYVANKKNVAYRMGYVRSQTKVADKGGQEIIKTRIPYSEYLKRKRKNPELMDFKDRKEYIDKKTDGFVDEVKTSPIMEKLKEKMPEGFKKKIKSSLNAEQTVGGKKLSASAKKVFINKNPVIRGMYHSVHKALDKHTDTLEGMVESKYIKGGKGYDAAKAYKDNFADHVKNNPGVFRKGVAEGVITAGAMGLGGKMLIDSKKEEAPKRVKKTAQIDNYMEAIYKEAGILGAVKNFAKKILPKANTTMAGTADSAVGATKGLSDRLKAGENLGNTIKASKPEIAPLATNTKSKVMDTGKSKIDIPFKDKAKIAGKASLATVGAGVTAMGAVKAVKDSSKDTNSDVYKNQQGFVNTAVQ